MRSKFIKLLIISTLISLVGCSNSVDDTNFDKEITQLETTITQLKSKLGEKENEINELKNLLNDNKQNLDIKERQFKLIEKAILNNKSPEEIVEI